MQLSFSQLFSYGTCPRQYEFAYVKKLSRGISAGESFGSSVHNALRKWGEEEIKNAECIIQNGPSTVSTVQLGLFPEVPKTKNQKPTLELLRQFWHQSFIVEGYTSKADADAARARGEKLMEYFFAWWKAEKREVLAVEKGFSLSLSSLSSASSASSVLSGRFDRIERCGDGLRIIDFKTGSVREQEHVDEDLQLSLYALAAEEQFQLPCKELMLLFLREDGLTAVSTTRTSMQLHAARSRISALGEGITAGRFAPTPLVSACARCPYRNVCDAAAT